jgi:formylglycine-generating enzyme required for sulfatase activity
MALIVSACDDVQRDPGTLDLGVQGQGHVLVDTLGVGISGYPELALYPVPDSGYVFDRWEVGASGHDSPLIIQLAGRVRVDAVFGPIPQAAIFDGIQFSYIPEGGFRMGSNFAFEDEREQPVHDVTISRPFYLSRYEVTQAQWERVMGYNNSPVVGANRPVTGVSWFEAQDFVNALNATSLQPLYRLPTEAEWEYACRAGTTTAFFHGDDEGRLRDYAWYFDNWAAGVGMHPVGQKRPNRWGLYDMLGNAWEWVNDAFDPNYYAVSPAFDPQGPAAATLGRVLRGGGDTGVEWTRCAARGNEFPEVQAMDIGFRIVRVIP